MKYFTARPTGILSNFIKQYWSIENCNPGIEGHINRIIPNGLFELIFYLGDKPVSLDENRSIVTNSVITGQLAGYYDIKVSGKLSIFSIQFKPHGLSMFLDIPLNEFINQNIPLNFIFKYEANKLENRLFEAESFEKRVIIIESFFLSFIRKKHLKQNFDRINECIKLITLSKGTLDITTLASETCFSRKQFERTFSDFIGTSPKQFLKIVRFQNAINEKSKDKNLKMTSLTYKCGYYDQSHMINEFKKFTGMSPKKFFGDCDTSSDYFL